MTMDEYKSLIERQKSELETVKTHHRKELQALRVKFETQRFEMRKKRILIPEFYDYVMEAYQRKLND